MKKIAIISPGFLPVPAIKGGAIEQLIETIILLNEHESEYNISLFTINNEQLKNYHFNNTKIIEVKTTIIDKVRNRIYNYGNKLLGKPYKHNIPYTYAVTRKMKNQHFDYIVVENNMSIVVKLPKTDNIIFHLHNDIFGIDKPRYQCEIVGKKCKKILAVSEYIKNRFLTIDNNIDIEVLTNCIDFSEYDINRFDTTSIEKQREKWNISKNDFVYIFTGRIVEEKGIVELIKSFNKLCKEYSNIKLLILGDYNIADKKLKDFIVEKALSNGNIKLLGYTNQKEIPLSLFSSDVVVIPSKWQEPFGLVAIEAMAMKKPIIATKVGGMIEQLDNECVEIVEVNDLENNLYNAMKYFYENEEVRNIKSLNAYNKVKNDDAYNSKTYLKRFSKILNNI